MNFEDKKRHQNLKIFISETVMVLSVLIIVVALGFLVSGYWLNSNLEIERQGMLHISSTPVAADVEIDGKSAWLQVTNMSKVLSVGEHDIVLTKDGYDSWSKTVNISEGLLYRIHYPRLFLLEREKETVFDMSKITKIFYAKDKKTALLYSGDIDLLNTDIYVDPTNNLLEQKNKDADDWLEIDFTQETISPKPIQYKTLFSFFAERKVDTKTDAEKLKNFGFKGELSGKEKLLFFAFYDDDYLVVLEDQKIAIYKKPSDVPVYEGEFSFVPEISKIGHNGEFLIFSSGINVVSLDMEAFELHDWSIDGQQYDWLDDDMIYSIKDGELFVYDYDGLNRRSLAKNVSENNAVFIIEDKWLYYFSEENNLVREWLISH